MSWDFEKEIKEFKNKTLNCISEDGIYDLNKKYRFSYEKLISDDRIQTLSMHKKWTDKLKKYDKFLIKVIDEEEGTLPEANWASIARNWCIEED